MNKYTKNQGDEEKVFWKSPQTSSKLLVTNIITLWMHSKQDSDYAIHLPLGGSQPENDLVKSLKQEKQRRKHVSKLDMLLLNLKMYYRNQWTCLMV